MKQTSHIAITQKTKEFQLRDNYTPIWKRKESAMCDETENKCGLS